MRATARTARGPGPELGSLRKCLLDGDLNSVQGRALQSSGGGGPSRGTARARGPRKLHRDVCIF